MVFRLINNEERENPSVDSFHVLSRGSRFMHATVYVLNGVAVCGSADERDFSGLGFSVTS